MSVTEQIVEKVKELPEDKARDLLVYVEQKEREEAEEDRLDIEAARRALAEADKEGWIPWNQVKAELELESSPEPKKSRRLAKATKT